MTDVSSSSSKSQPESSAKAGKDKLPLVELQDVGVWYRLHGRKPVSFKESLFSRKLLPERKLLWALRNVSVECHEGQVWGFIGRNGAGKSTLCLILARILLADEGVAHVRGTATPLLSLGTGFHAEMTGRANVYLYSAFLGTPRKIVDEKMDGIIEFSGLGDFIDQPIYTYSSGMRARLGFSVACALDPEILILDEVLGVGDREFKHKSQARIMQMMETSKLIVIVSHSNAFLRKICTHCLWLDKGEVMMSGEAGKVLDAYEEATDA